MEIDFASLLKNVENSCDPSPFCRPVEGPAWLQPQPNAHCDASPADAHRATSPADTHPGVSLAGMPYDASCTKKTPGARPYKAYKRKKAREDAYRHGKRVSSAKKRVAAMSSAIHHRTTLSSGKLPAARDGYTSKNNTHHPSKDSAHNWTVQELLEEGFDLMQWDGW